MARPVIIAESVCHAYRSATALQDISFQVADGSLFGLLGPNGSGKTTLFRLLSTLLPLQQGHVQIGDFSLSAAPEQIRRQIGVTFQSPALDVRLTVLENLRCHAAIYGLSRNDAGQRISQLLQRFTVSDRARAVVGTLSGGLRRRVELARGLIHSPRLLLLDEPTTGLDVRSRREFFRMLDEQRQECGTTIVLATHLMEEAEQCDQLLLLDHGRVIHQGSPGELTAMLPGERLSIRCRDTAGLRPALTQLLQAEPKQFDDRLEFQLPEPARRIPEILDQFGDQVLSLQISAASLEDVFLARTGRLLSTIDSENRP